MARVVVDVPLPHLDRTFDYVVPEPLSGAARPGTRVRVRFSGKLVDGWVVERAASSTHPGRLERIDRPVAEAVPLFWRFMKKKFGVEAGPPVAM